MNPPVETMRNYIRKMYDSDRWKRQVRRMSDNQITAIYLKEQKKEEAAKARGKKPKNPDIPF